ncbi:hypothetical protein CROQUDRAFT_110246 [Cronartium quercuum f. sp. fusiforme G11]|uniref:Uncharacterized protein n=1 Tax=Cronartium quercuum f. sp. fusiforme G11 TaxID=708437 RepID=A0A9P6NCN3_9BASI|nr:hypothetical protein CROQUDRAFT_110246 [Cronartium quercuum f. sp. fusiforme G11]
MTSFRFSHRKVILDLSRQKVFQKSQQEERTSLTSRRHCRKSARRIHTKRAFFCAEISTVDSKESVGLSISKTDINPKRRNSTPNMCFQSGQGTNSASQGSCPSKKERAFRHSKPTRCHSETSTGFLGTSIQNDLKDLEVRKQGRQNRRNAIDLESLDHDSTSPQVADGSSELNTILAGKKQPFFDPSGAWIDVHTNDINSEDKNKKSLKSKENHFEKMNKFTRNDNVGHGSFSFQVPLDNSLHSHGNQERQAPAMWHPIYNRGCAGTHLPMGKKAV